MLASYILDPSRTIDDVYSVVSEFGIYYVPNDESIYGKGKSCMSQKKICFLKVSQKGNSSL